MLRIGDVLFRIRILPIPNPGSEFFHPASEFFYPVSEFFRPGFESKNLSILTQKIVSTFSDPDPDFLPIPVPGSRGQKGTGSRIRSTASHLRLGLFARRWPAGGSGPPPTLILLTPVRLGLRVVLRRGTPATQTHNDDVMNSVADP